MRLCEIDGCDRKHMARGLCGTHYERWRRNGTTELKHQTLCCSEGCEREHYGRGLCRKHWDQQYKLRNPDKAEEFRERTRAWREKNLDKVRAQQRAYRQANAERYRAYNLTYYPKNKEKFRASQLKRYGLTLESYEQMFDRQAGKCAICRKAFFDGKTNVDHCHDTGRVRGLLCKSCNVGLGMLGDNLDGLMRAVEYLKEAE